MSLLPLWWGYLRTEGSEAEEARVTALDATLQGVFHVEVRAQTSGSFVIARRGFVAPSKTTAE